MVYSVRDEQESLDILVDESVWTGKRIVTANGQQAEVLSKNAFLHRTGDGRSVRLEIRGNMLTGLFAVVDGRTLVIYRKLKWYEILFSLIPIFLMFVGGAIGGALAGAALITNILIMRKVNNIFLKFVVAVAVALCAWVVYAVVAFFIFGVFSMLPNVQ